MSVHRNALVRAIANVFSKRNHEYSSIPVPRSEELPVSLEPAVLEAFHVYVNKRR